MPPIPVHIDDPITPKKADEATPETAPGAAVHPAPASNVATTTQAAAAPYPAAQPGAAAVPAPTRYTQRPQAEPTRTTSAAYHGPPPPQPGAVPVPPGQQVPMTAAVPPPPRADQTAQQGSAFTGALNNMHTPPPPQPLQQNYAPMHSTTTAGITPNQATTTQRSGPTTLNLGPVTSPTVGSAADTRRVSSEHPQGYVQNVYAQELSSAQRASLEAEKRRPSFAAGLGLGGGDGEGAGRRSGEWGEQANGAWNAAKGWLGKAGTALAEREQEVWKMINGR